MTDRPALRVPDRELRADERGDSRQLLLVGLAALGLVVAAFAVPPGAGDGDRPGPGEPGPGDGTARTGGDGGPGGGGGSGGGGSGGDPAGSLRDPGTGYLIVDGAQGTRRGEQLDPDEVRRLSCAVVLLDEPVPGTVVSVAVVAEGRPVSGRQVWFGDRAVGRTGPDGRVTGEVPWRERFRVTTAVDGRGECSFLRVAKADRVAGAAVAPAGWVEPVPTVGTRQTGPGVGNATGTYRVTGDIEVTVEGEAYAGEPVSVRATVADRPVPGGAVVAGGERVDDTGPAGRARVPVPEGADRVRVAVVKGELSGSTTVEVLDPALALSAARPLPLPGQTGVARLTVGGRPLPDTVVTLDGEPVGRTDRQGRVRFAIPGDPGATLRVEAAGDTATATPWRLVAVTGAVTAALALLAVGSTGLAARRAGRARARRVGLAWLAVGLVYGGYVAGGDGGGGLAAGVVVLGAAARWLYRRRTGETEPRGVAELLAAALRRVVRVAVRVADRLSAFADWLRRRGAGLRAWLGGLPRSVPALLAALGAGLAGLVGSFVGGLRRLPALALGVLGAARTAVTLRRLVAAGALGLLTAGVWVWAGPGLAVGALVAGLLALVLAAGSRRGSDGAESRPEPVPSAEETSTVSGEEPVTLRACWRALARLVAPDTWRSRTPGEIARAAVERGLPAEPVRSLTRTFREAEYGEREATETDHERATAALDRVRDAEGER